MKMKKKSQQAAPQFAVCIDNSGYPASLALRKIYRVLRDEEAAQDSDLRVVDESGEDYLYPARNFLMVALPKAVERAAEGFLAAEPSFWTSRPGALTSPPPKNPKKLFLGVYFFSVLGCLRGRRPPKSPLLDWTSPRALGSDDVAVRERNAPHNHIRTSSRPS